MITKFFTFCKSAIVLMVLLVACITANAQVSVNVQVLPPFLYHFTDYASHPQQLLVTVLNTSASVQRIQLRGSMTGDNGVSVTVKPGYRSRSPLILNPGQLKLINGADITDYFDFAQLLYTGTNEGSLIRNNTLPEGNYRLCVQAYNYDTNAVLSGGSPIGCSNLFSITNLEPPTIINPFNGGVVNAGAAQVFTISWSTPPGAPPTTLYHIRMVEILGNRNPNDALMSTLQPYFFEKQVMGNMYLYSPSDPQMTPGRSYAMLVQAVDPNQTVNFKNNGLSAATSFTYQSLINGGVLSLAAAPAIASPVAGVPTINDYSTTVTGNLKWYLRQSEEAPGGNYNTAGKTGNAMANITVQIIGVSTAKTIVNKLVKSMPAGSAARTQVLGTATTDAQGNFTFKFLNPLFTDKTIASYQLKLSLSDARFAIADKAYPLTAATTLAMGSVQALANTYRYIANVNSTDSILAAALVNVYRPASYYAADKVISGEGMMAQNAGSAVTELINGEPCVKIGSVKAGQPLNGLFADSSGNRANSYRLVVSAAGFNTYATTFIQSASGGANASAAVSYTQTYTLTRFTNMFAGHVFKNINGQSANVSNVLITIVPAGPGANNLTSATDQQGKFTASLGTIGAGTNFDYYIKQAGDRGALGDYHATATVSAQAQPVEIQLPNNAAVATGKVIDQDGNAVSGAGISLTSSGKQLAVTASDGTFSFNTTLGADSVSVTSTAYTNQVLPVNFTTANQVVPTITVHKISGQLYTFKVVDNNNTPLVGANVNGGGVSLMDAGQNSVSALITNVNGTVSGYIPNTVSTVYITGPPASNFITLPVDLTQTSQNNTINVVLQHGITLSGTVTVNGTATANAHVTIDGLDYLNAQTDANGFYSINTYPGSNALDAVVVNSGSTQVSGNYNASAVVNLPIVNQGSIASSITTLAGFPVQIATATAQGQNQLISGTITNIPANNIFSAAAGTTIRFSNLAVSINNHNAVPVSGNIITDETSINVKAYNYLPLIVDNNGSPITINMISNTGNGQIQGMAHINYSAFASALNLGTNSSQYVLSEKKATPEAINLFNGDGSSPVANLFLAGTGTQQILLNGLAVTLTLASSNIGTDGIHFGGAISLNNVPLCSNALLPVQDLTVNTAGNIQSVTFTDNINVAFGNTNWVGSITGATYSNNGVTLAGSVLATLKDISKVNFNFSGLQAAPKQLFGGSFVFPANGINLFAGLVVEGASAKYSLGKSADSSSYMISGTGTMTLPQIATKINVTNLSVLSNGKMSVDAGINESAVFAGLVNIDIRKISISDTSGVAVDVLGGIALDEIPDFEAVVSTVHYGPNNAIAIDDLGFSLDIPDVGSVDLSVGFKHIADTLCFRGEGKIKIEKLSDDDVNVAFYYDKYGSGGFRTGGKFSIPVEIALGESGFAITSVGGGFTLNKSSDKEPAKIALARLPGLPGLKSVNKEISGQSVAIDESASPSKWSATLTGTIQDDARSPLDHTDLSLTFTSDALITGSATCYLPSTTVTGNISLDVPNRMFTLSATNAGNADLIPAFCASTNMFLVLGFKSKADAFFFIGAETSLESFNDIIKRNAEIYAGYNFNAAQNASVTASFIKTADPDNKVFGGKVFNGIGARIESDINYKSDIDIGIGSVKSWFTFDNFGTMHANWGDKKLYIDMGSTFDIGGSIKVGYKDFSVSGNLDVDYSADINAVVDLTNSKSPNLQAYGKGNAKFAFNYNASGCDNGVGLAYCYAGKIKYPCDLKIQVCKQKAMAVAYNSSYAPGKRIQIGF